MALYGLLVHTEQRSTRAVGVLRCLSVKHFVSTSSAELLQIDLRFDVDINPLNAKETMHLKMSSAEVVCCKLLPHITDELSIEANSVDAEQTAPIGEV